MNKNASNSRIGSVQSKRRFNNFDEDEKSDWDLGMDPKTLQLHRMGNNGSRDGF